jgi:membrane protease YdiL (CAAX protease family)
MLNRYLTFYSPAIQFMVFCVMLSFSVIIGSILFSILSERVTGLTLAEINNLKDIPELLGSQLKKINTLSLAISLLLPAGLFAYLAYPQPAQYLGLTLKIKKHHWLWAITLLLIALPFTSLLEQWNQHIPAFAGSHELDEQYDRLARSMLAASTLNGLMSNILFICIAPALIEELLFRACLQRILLAWMSKKPYMAIFIVAILFSAFHGQLSGFFPRLFLGLLLGLTYYFSGSIWISIIMHVLNNFVTVFFVYLYNQKLINMDVTHLPDMNMLFGLLSGIAVAGLLFLFYKDRKPYEPIEVEKEDIII